MLRLGSSVTVLARLLPGLCLKGCTTMLSYGCMSTLMSTARVILASKSIMLPPPVSAMSRTLLVLETPCQQSCLSDQVNLACAALAATLMTPPPPPPPPIAVGGEPLVKAAGCSHCTDVHDMSAWYGVKCCTSAANRPSADLHPVLMHLEHPLSPQKPGADKLRWCRMTSLLLLLGGQLGSALPVSTP